MENDRTLNQADVFTNNPVKTLMIVGPKPPPMGGSPLTVQTMLEELALYPSMSVMVINTSPALDVRKKMTGFNFEKVRRSFAILPRYLYDIRGCDAVMVFANELFAITFVPTLFLGARLFRKPFYLKPVGAGLDLFITRQKKLLRWYLLAILHSMDGILTQTRNLKDELEKMGCTNVYYLPGCRPVPQVARRESQNPNELKLIFLAHITRRKGPLVLLQALQNLAQICDKPVSCDFYGPIHDEIREEFLEQLRLTPNARYCGLAEIGTGTKLIANYDALVLPTYFDTEGHPGVLIEAMHAGVPVITTQIRTISDLVTDGENGLLVPTQDSYALAEAIKQMVMEPLLREKMGKENYLKGREFRADVVVAQMLKFIFPNASLGKE